VTLDKPDNGVFGRAFKAGAWLQLLLVARLSSAEDLWKTFHTTSVQRWKR